MQTPTTQLFDTQSLGVWQGKTQRPYWGLQWCSPHAASLVQGIASGPGVDSEVLLVGAGVGGAVGVGVGTGGAVGVGAGVGAGGVVYVGCGAGGYVGYGVGAAVG